MSGSSIPSVKLPSPSNGYLELGPGPSSAPRRTPLPHGFRPEELIRLEGIVLAAAELNIRHIRRAPRRVWHDVMELQERTFGAAASGSHEGPRFFPVDLQNLSSEVIMPERNVWGFGRSSASPRGLGHASRSTRAALRWSVWPPSKAPGTDA